jgi:8-oxo-dGTP diphosphatase
MILIMLNVTCAVIRNEENEVLVVQRGEASDHPYKWEFPGGKLTDGETEDECIIREIREELSMEIIIFGRLPVVKHDYGMKQIRLIPFICDTLDELPLLSEHIAFRWVVPKDLLSFDYSEADVFVAQSYLERQQPENQPKPPSDPEIENKKADADLQKIVNNMMSMKEAEWVATSAIENPAIFLKLYEYSFSSDKHLAFRASWTLTKVCDKFPEMIVPYLPQIIDTLDKIENVGALRSFLRIISQSDLNAFKSREHGFLTDFCFNILKSGDSAIAVKAYSMEILYKLAVIYPDLANELSSSIIVLMEDGSAGITSRGNTILKKLADLPPGTL